MLLIFLCLAGIRSQCKYQSIFQKENVTIEVFYMLNLLIMEVDNSWEVNNG